APAAALSTALLAQAAASAAVPRAAVRATMAAAVRAITPAAASRGVAALALAALVACVGLASLWSTRVAPPQVAGPGGDKSATPRRLDREGDPLPPGVLARLGTTRFRHEAWVDAAAFSPDGHTLATASAGQVTLWDAATGRPRRGLEHAGGT